MLSLISQRTCALLFCAGALPGQAGTSTSVTPQTGSPSVQPHHCSFPHPTEKFVLSRTDSRHKSFKPTEILCLGEILRYRVGVEGTPQNLLSPRTLLWPRTTQDCISETRKTLEKGRSPGHFYSHWKQICLVLRKAENWIEGNFTWVFDLQQAD